MSAIYAVQSIPSHCQLFIKLHFQQHHVHYSIPSTDLFIPTGLYLQHLAGNPSENQKNVSTKSAFSTSVDKVANVIPTTHYTSVAIANILTTAYPPPPVDKGTVVLKPNLW